MANSSPIYAPLDEDGSNPPASPPPPPTPTRIARIASLDQRLVSGCQRSLGAGGASSLFARAVEKALVDEMADQLRGQERARESDIGAWAAEIIAAFKEE